MPSRVAVAPKKAPRSRLKKKPAPKRTRRTKTTAAPTTASLSAASPGTEETHDAILELTDALFAAVDREGRIHTCSGAWAECLHLTRDKIVGQALPAMLESADCERWHEWLRRILAGHTVGELELRFKGNGRGTVWLSVRPRLSASREAVHLLARDVTAEKLAADNPPPSDLVLEEIEEGVLVIDATRSGFPIVNANSPFSKLTGYKITEAINRPLAFLAGPSTDIAELDAALGACTEGLNPTAELCFHRKDGTPFWSRVRLCPVTGSDRSIRQIVAILLDTSERHIVIDALREKNLALTEALESLQKTKEAIVQRERMHALGKMASGMVHDFNNLLAPILGFTELLLSIPDLLNDSEKVSLYLQKIRTAANDGASVVARLREFYRSRADVDPPAEFSAHIIVRESLDLTRHRWHNEAQAAGQVYDLVVDLQETPKIFGSEAEIRQALTNIVLNALDAMPEGGTLRVRTYQVGNWVCVQVADTGVGMAEDVRRRCFEPFFTTKGRAGTGLGLSIVFGIVERHHGRVDLHSAEGHGTTFTIWLPIDRKATTTENGSAAPAQAGEGEGRPLSVLVVDDEDLLLEVISMNLLNMGHSVDCFTSPKQAIEQFYKKDYDLVITDRAMPDMTGDHFAKIVREFRPDTPIVLLTGFANIIRENGETPPNIDEILSKPLSRQTLCDLMARHGGRSQSVNA